MRFILEFKDYSERESKTRTKSLSEEEFLEILKKECSQFSFENDQLYRGTNNSFGEFGLFLESERKGTIGQYSYKDFFDDRKGYPVPRYKSLIGTTTKLGKIFASESNLYLVIPFDNAEIVFAGSPDIAIWSKKGQEFTDDLFILEKYKNNFKVPVDKLTSIRNSSTIKDYDTKLEKYGFEFFTNSNCLLLDIDKVDWLKAKMSENVSESLRNKPTYEKYLSYEDLKDIMFDITDEFSEVEWFVYNSVDSHLLKNEVSDNKFLIELINKGDNSIYKNLHFLEPKIFEILEHVSNKLELYGLQIIDSDFGETDASYEIIIGEKV